MISFLICLLLLVVGYYTYGRFVERIIAPNSLRKTPAVLHPDGVDYMPMSGWRMLMIQFLNIAGLGPIFGAIMGAKFGSSAYVWIVLGTIFAGSVHDYVAGMMSLRHDGENLPDLIGRYLGRRVLLVMRIITLLMLVLVGAVFVAGPAGLLAKFTPAFFDDSFWIILIFLYYLLATLLPIDKVIGKIYPLFAFSLIFMGVGILFFLILSWPTIPELWDGLDNIHPQADQYSIGIYLFVNIACGAISGFHATQSPMMARCMINENQGRPIFFGAMIIEGIMALIWAGAATAYYAKNGMGETNASIIVNSISHEYLGAVGALVAVLGVIAAPITSGDTALRSARLIAASFFGVDQQKISKRLLISIPLFLITSGILYFSLLDNEGFNRIWQYFAFFNQLLATITLWAATVYLFVEGKNYWICLFPATFMSYVCIAYVVVDILKQSELISYLSGCGGALLLFLLFIRYRNRSMASK